ncbi:MAG: DNA methyltransferase [Gemmatimonadaceae bacterium]
MKKISSKVDPARSASVPPNRADGSDSIAGIEEASLESLHRFHSYCARFPSEIVESAIAEYTRPEESIYDPFCGSGTSLAAGLMAKRYVIGSDIDVLAGMLSDVKCAPKSRTAYSSWCKRFEARVEELFDQIAYDWPPFQLPEAGEPLKLGELTLTIPDFPELTYWFPPQVIALLAGISTAAHRCRDPHFERVALISLSASIIAKWPNTLSYAMDIDHTRPHRVFQRFTRTRVLDAYKKRLRRTVDCLGKLHEMYAKGGVVSRLGDLSRVICPHDARQPAPGVEDESQALVVTSPPYFNAVDYPRAHRMSVCWMNGHAPEGLASRRQYIGIRHVADIDGQTWFAAQPELVRFVPAAVRSNGRLRRLAAFFDDLDASLRQIWRVLRPGGHAVIVIADNTVRGHRVESHAALAELARQIGFAEVDRRPRAIATVRRRFPVGQFGFDGPMTHEHVIVLRRPAARRRAAKSDMPAPAAQRGIWSEHRNLE